jgi:hypothetical protein
MERYSDSRNVEKEVIEEFSNGSLIVDVGDSTENWETLYDKTVDDIERVISD